MKKLLTTFLLLTICYSCSYNDDPSESSLSPEGFDRQAMLVNLTENIIIPSFNDLDIKLNDLKNNLDLFAADINLESMKTLRESFIDAYKAWQHVEMFNIGKAEEIYYVQKMNVYPSNIVRIENNMSKDDLNLDQGQNEFSAQGFPAVDFMLFGIADNNDEIISMYNQQNSKYLSHLYILVNKMVSNTSIVVKDWEAQRSEFVTLYGNNSSSNLNMLVNDYVYYFEKGIRTNKFGIPAGRWALKRPQNVEAFYAKNLSKTLALEAIIASKNFFTGVSTTTKKIEGESFKTYLDYLENNDALSSSILSSFNSSKDKIESLEDNFAEIVRNDNLKLLEVFQELQEGVILLKTDMISIMDISVDYMDADGD